MVAVAELPATHAIAREGRCLVLSACQNHTRACRPPDYACIQGADPTAVLFWGGNFVSNHAGSRPASAQSSKSDPGARPAKLRKTGASPTAQSNAIRRLEIMEMFS